jgi:predicted nucleotide-binding protein
MVDYPQRVFVVHGRNWKIKKEVFAFLRKIGLSPISWGEAVSLTGGSASYIGQALNAALDQAEAVVVLLTGDDEVYIDGNVHHQPRANVLFEAGMAFTRIPKRTILVELDDIRFCRALVGRYRIRLSNDFQNRMDFIRSLRNVGCIITLPTDEEIRNTGDFSIS